MEGPESTSAGRRLQRLSQSALELSLIGSDEIAGSASVSPLDVAVALPSDQAVKHVSANTKSASCVATSSSPSAGNTTGRKSAVEVRKPSPIRAFLTPPLMRKRKTTAAKHGRHDEDHSASTTRLCGASNKGKSFGFLGLLKAKFVDRSGRCKQQPVVQETYSTSVLDQMSNVSSTDVSQIGREQQDEHVTQLTGSTVEPNSLRVDPATLSLNMHPEVISRKQESMEQPLLCASAGLSAGLSAAVATATSSVIPKLNIPKKVSIGGTTTKRGMTHHSSLDHSTDLKHVTVATVVSAPAVTPLGPPPTSMLQPGSIQPAGPFRLHVLLKQGRELAAKDSCGTSDPYVKFKLGNKVVYRSKTVYRDLNPVWDEEFDVNLDELNIPLQIRVFDYDWGMQDDFLGSCVLDLSQLEVNRTNGYSLDLFSDEVDGRQGIIDLSISLHPKPIDDDQDHKSLKLSDQAKKLKVQIWSSVVNILVIEGKHLADKDGASLMKPYLRLRLGNEKYKTKSVTRNSGSTSVTWLEQFDFHLYEDQSHLLEINLHEKCSLGREESIARAVLDLAGVEGERTHPLNCQFQQGGTGTLSLLVTISGTTASETISDLSTHQPVSQSKEELIIKQRYSLWRTLNNMRDVGHLSVKVFRASGLASADLGGKSDPFCVLQLVNARLQTQTEYKTLTPSWNKIFTFNVKDINSVLQVTVYDEDRDHRFEFLGAVAIPLLRIENGQKRWYALKDTKLRARAKGQNPQILLELNIVWNEIRATIQTLQPKEKKYIEPELKFNRHTFVRNVMRVKTAVMEVIEIGKYIESCWEWESNTRSCIGFAVFLVVTWNFEPYLIPLMLLLPFLRHFVIRSFTHTSVREYDSDHASGDDDDDDDEKNKEERKSLKERLQSIQEATLTVQNSIGYIASLFESIRNTFNFSVPFLSYLAILLLIAACVLLYAVPLRYLILAWGVNKFTRKLLRPHSIPNNEALDFLSRVPDDEQLADYRELRLEVPAETSDKPARKVPKKK